jgi:cell shape-determining protein MreC
MFDLNDIEDIIIGMANIVLENRALRKELEEMRKYKEMYYELVNENLRSAEESNRMLLKACLMGAFNVGGNAE